MEKSSDIMIPFTCDTQQHLLEKANDIQEECNKKRIAKKNSKMEDKSIQIPVDSYQEKLSLDRHHQDSHQHHLSHNSDTDSALSSAPPSISPQPPSSGVEPSSIWQTVGIPGRFKI